VSRRDEIVGAARELLEREGRSAVTMRRLAQGLGVQAPSLYKHVSDKDELEAALADLAREELAAALAGAPALDEAARRYRAWALDHPHLYRLATERPLPDGVRPTAGADRAESPLLEVVGDEHRARAAWAFAHGMVELELAGRLPDAAGAWRAGVEAFAGAPAQALRPAPERAVFRSFRVD